MRYLLLLSLLACQRTHDVTIELGPDNQRISVGFQCRRLDNTFIGDIALAGDRLKFRVVVDIIDLGGGLPGCRGEELVQTCATPGRCSIATRSDGTRFCAELDLPIALLGLADQSQLVATVHDQLTKQAITTDAPDRPVLIRSVATTETCDAFEGAGAATHAFAQAQVIGCAYSCPVQLDDIAGPIALSLDVFDDHCEAQVKVCASFPP